jgi:hypothetical protein
MKKSVLLTIMLLAGGILFAQEKKTAAKKQAASQTGSTCYTDKKWMLYKVEKFGQEKDPKPEMKSDFLQLKSDNTFTLKYNGIDKFGTYTRGGILQLKMGDGSETWPFKVISCEGSMFKVDYRDGDTHNILTYKAE